jgi:TolB-like protein
MRRAVFIGLVSLIAVGLISCSSSKKVVRGPKLTIAVLDFEARAGVKPEEAQVMRDAFVSLLQQTGMFTVVDRNQTQKILTEQQFQSAQSENVEAAGGKMLAVRKLVSGSVGKLGDDYIFNIKMTDVENAGVDFAVSKMFNGDLEDVVEDLFPEFVDAMVNAVGGRK